jgi:anti-sigma factor RsiW
MGPLPDLPCRELVELITDYLEDALPADVRARFDAHLADCPGCVMAIEQFRTTILGLRGLDDDEIPAPVREGLLAAFRDWSPAGSAG